MTERIERTHGVTSEELEWPGDLARTRDLFRGLAWACPGGMMAPVSSLVLQRTPRPLATVLVISVAGDLLGLFVGLWAHRRAQLRALVAAIRARSATAEVS